MSATSSAATQQHRVAEAKTSETTAAAGAAAAKEGEKGEKGTAKPSLSDSQQGGSKHPRKPHGHYFAVRGRLWRRTPIWTKDSDKVSPATSWTFSEK